MQMMSGDIQWYGRREDRVELGTDCFSDEFLSFSNLRKSALKTGNKPYYYNPESRVLSAVIGYMSDTGPHSDTVFVEDHYRRYGIDALPYIDGLFLAFIYDAVHQTAFVIQSAFACGLPLYYKNMPQGFIFSTSLKKILQMSNEEPTLDSSAVHDFLHNGRTIPNKSTLVKGIEKLTPGQCMRINIPTRKISMHHYKKSYPVVSMAQAKNRLLPSIIEHLNCLIRQNQEKPLYQTLTAGWDTNLMFTQISKHPVSVLTINGGNKQNEVPSVKKILQNHHHVKLLKDSVEADIVSHLPDIVWRTEGYVFQEGLFLRYVLSRLSKKFGIQTLFLASLADQMMNPISHYKFITKKISKFTKRFLLDYLSWGNNAVKRAENILRRRIPFTKVMYRDEVDYNIKMHEILLNSFGVNGLYPFICNEAIAHAAILKKINKKKRFYKDQLRHYIPPSTIQHIAKSGNVVDTKYLYKENESLLLPVLDTPFVKESLPQKIITDIKREPINYHLLILQLIYLFVFNELFISGKFISQFDNPGFSGSLSSLMAPACT